MPKATGSSADAFWSRVDIPIDLSDCWMWTGSTRHGYGLIGFHGRQWLAHRLAYTLWHGEEAAKGMHTDHICRVRGCVNPAHLRVVTPRENIFAPGSLCVSKLYSLRTHCKHGHAFAGDNLRSRGGVRRGCFTCREINRAKSLAKLKALNGASLNA